MDNECDKQSVQSRIVHPENENNKLILSELETTNTRLVKELGIWKSLKSQYATQLESLKHSEIGKFECTQTELENGLDNETRDFLNQSECRNGGMKEWVSKFLESLKIEVS